MATKKEASNGHKRPPKDRPIPTDDVGLSYINCTMCVIEAAKTGQHIKEYARMTVSFTDIGLQVYCLRHEVNIIHIDFQGTKPPANLQT